jgi:hypothetical protein
LPDLDAFDPAIGEQLVEHAATETADSTELWYRRCNGVLKYAVHPPLPYWTSADIALSSMKFKISYIFWV